MNPTTMLVGDISLVAITLFIGLILGCWLGYKIGTAKPDLDAE